MYNVCVCVATFPLVHEGRRGVGPGAWLFVTPPTPAPPADYRSRKSPDIARWVTGVSCGALARRDIVSVTGTKPLTAYEGNSGLAEYVWRVNVFCVDL